MAKREFFAKTDPLGPVAQWSELTAHNRLVAGSSPAGPTNRFNNFHRICNGCPEAR
jgi:hypothetical protein